MYGLNPFPESIQIADYIKSHTNKNDRIAVIGSEPQIYFYADRLSATGYIYTYGLMEDQKYALTMQREMIHEIESTKPKYMVIVGISVSWLRNPNSKTLIFDWCSRYTQEYYKEVGLIDIASPDWTDYYWDRDVRGKSPNSNCFLFVLERKRS